MTTLQVASRTVVKMAEAVPGTPTMPVPSTEMRQTLSMVAKPLTMPSPREAGRLLRVRREEGGLAGGTSFLSPSSTCAAITVPGAARLKKLRMAMGTPARMAGWVVRGWSTDAPK